MTRIRLGISLLAMMVLFAAAVACGAEPTATPDFAILPPPTDTPEPVGSVSTPSATSTAGPTRDASTSTPVDSTPEPTESATAIVPTEAPAYPAPPVPLNADDLGHLPDDPNLLMYAAFDYPMADVGRKMAYSHNPAFIPVLLEFLRFQSNEEARLTMASFMVRIKDRIPEEDFTIVPDGQGDWGWWVKWVAEHPEVTPPHGFDGWKGKLFSYIDEPMGAFMYDGVPTTIRLEEIVWGGVRRDGIPDLRFPPHISPDEATYLEPGDRVFGVSINGEHRAYPLRVLNPHEMANDIVGGVQFALAY